MKNHATLLRKAKRVLATLVVTAVGTLGAGTAAAEMKIRLGHVFAINSPVDEASKDFARLVSERTNGEITVALFPNSQLGGDEALARELSRGSIELAFLNPGSLAGLDPLLDIHYLPYIATSFKEADAIFYNPQGVLQTTLRTTLARHKMQALGFFELEFRAVTNSKQAVEKVSDLKGLKLRVPGSAGIKGFFEAAGAQAVAMPFPELFTALQQGTVDGQDNGASITYNSRLFEAQKFMTTTNHVYAMGAITASERFWGRLSAEQRKILQDTAAEVSTRQIQKNRELNATFLKKIGDGGVRVTVPTPEAMAEFQRVGDSLWDKLAPIYGTERIKALREEVAKLRKP
ncbi:TRAP transporter substrate-binding protein [Variovorax ginsengisoli]|jgi:tripartite ATP-independent transporter DctP family solute receptor|uniref:TRAP transporter substrate-binding protein n=1 Tax=Variovorax ginsengisoli TaxID=363844 RepID=A0ABT8RZJ9_9BURK|nr:TRAP transporter substrate-binding protein [Variovorax ginsengisoli]MDN8611987.1 TRAP transporter substrate-binding protein [Variovorax ginsengisoli]MDO1531157.1 TRAP transporter substrate-binding protein [Variovorax ginsengisoli]